ncbi:MAG TPA: asparagine synthase (glutamine-hydrolyzing), partial [Rugosibacter sp.]
MCGLTGFFSPTGLVENAAETVRRMSDAITHRGPDDAGVWVDEAAGVALAHRRLSILDLSPAGHQPMASNGGRYVIVFNGEIYNHLELREALSGMAWRGHSDTETMLAAIEVWGIEATLKKYVGMFALALWDRETRSLTLARDRMGEKPLYYGWQGNVFLFGSELKALRAHPAFRGEINRDVLALYLRHNYVPAPYSIYRGIAKLPPGSWLTLPADAPVAAPQGYFPGTDSKLRGVSPAPSRDGLKTFYWRARDAAQSGVRRNLDDATAIDELDTLLRRAVGGQMVADVPLGAFLSGGIDSSTVVALMQAQSKRPVQTFTIG